MDELEDFKTHINLSEYAAAQGYEMGVWQSSERKLALSAFLASQEPEPGFGNLPNDYGKLSIIVPLLVRPQEETRGLAKEDHEREWFERYLPLPRPGRANA